MQVRAARGACCERFGVSREDLASDPRPKAGRNPMRAASVRCSSPVHLAIGTRAETGTDRTDRNRSDRIGSGRVGYATTYRTPCTGLHRSAQVCSKGKYK